jgi:hypothetical protein
MALKAARRVSLASAYDALSASLISFEWIEKLDDREQTEEVGVRAGGVVPSELSCCCSPVRARK